MTMYQVVEHIGGKNETYMVGFETEKEMSNWLNGKRIWINEKKDSIVAWKISPEGFGWVDLESIWKLYSKKAA